MNYTYLIFYKLFPKTLLHAQLIFLSNFKFFYHIFMFSIINYQIVSREQNQRVNWAANAVRREFVSRWDNGLPCVFPIILSGDAHGLM